MKERILLPLYLLSAFAGVAASPPARHAPPPLRASARRHPHVKSDGVVMPRATVKLPGLTTHGADDKMVLNGIVAVTPQSIVFQTVKPSWNYATGLAIVERDRGNVLWSQEPQTITLRNQSINAHWELLGVSEPDKNNTSVLVFQKVTDFYPANAVFFSKKTEIEFYGTDDSGHWQRWQYPAGKTDPPNTLLTGARVVGNLLPVQGGSSGDPVLLWDARTGSPVDRTTQGGRVLVEEAIRANGSPLVQRSEPNHYSLLRLDTGQSFPFFGDNREETINVNAVGVTVGRAVWLKQGDNGGAGHSGFASSLWCSDGNGRIVWRFPVRTYYNGDFLDASSHLINPGEYARLYRDVLDAVLCGSRTEEPVVVCLVRHGSAIYMDALRVRDGKTLWSRPAAEDTSLVAVPEKAGAFVLTDGQQRWAFLNATTGKTQKIRTPLPTVGQLFIANDDLLRLDDKGVLRIYSIKKLLGTKTKFNARAD